MISKRDSSYQELLDSFGATKIEERYALTVQSARDFLNSLRLTELASVNTGLCREATLDYFSDIKRLKDFHQIERTNPPKVSAYLAYWVLRRKPIQLAESVSPEQLQAHPELASINEWWTGTLLISSAFDRSKQELQDKDQLRMWRAFLDHLYYYLTYRQPSPQALELMILGLYVTPDSPRLGR